MAKPVTFPQQNSALLGGPKEKWEGATGDVVDLPIFRHGDMIISSWQLSWRERLSALLFGKIWLWSLGARTLPPMLVKAERSPFTSQDADND